MAVLKLYKCICSLLSVSKCLYFIKKMICFLTVMLVALSVVMCICDKEKCKKFICDLKAVM